MWIRSPNSASGWAMPASFIKCPICARTVSLSDPQLPFCSRRCRQLDLGNWATGRYQIAAPLPEEELPSLPLDEEYGEEAGE
jgi:uncharacterized protein